MIPLANLRNAESLTFRVPQSGCGTSKGKRGHTEGDRLPDAAARGATGYIRMAEIKDPFEKFHAWYDEAKRSSHTLPNAMCLSTAGADGCPSARMVLLSSFDRRGFVFHTNYESRKAAGLAVFPRAALLFWW